MGCPDGRPDAEQLTGVVAVVSIFTAPAWFWTYHASAVRRTFMLMECAPVDADVTVHWWAEMLLGMDFSNQRWIQGTSVNGATSRYPNRR